MTTVGSRPGASLEIGPRNTWGKRLATSATGSEGLIALGLAPARMRSERIARKAPADLDEVPKWPALNTVVRWACEAISSQTSRSVRVFAGLRTACHSDAGIVRPQM